MKKRGLKTGNLVIYWHNYVAEGAIFIRWIDALIAELCLGDGSNIKVNGSTFDLFGSEG